VYRPNASHRLIVAFDDYFNLADPSSEVFQVSFLQDRTEFSDVAVSYKVISNIADHSIYFFSSSDGLMLSIRHNGTRVPALNFIRKNMQVEQVVSVLQSGGFRRLFDNSSTQNPDSSPAASSPRSLLQSFENVSSSPFEARIFIHVS
jgi:hypothetical protein